MLYLSLITVSTSTKNPIYKITIDGDEIKDPVSIDTIDQYKKRLIYQYNSNNVGRVQIELFNKGSNDTKVIDDKIVEDLLVIVDSFKIDGIDLTNNLSKISVYKDANGAIHKTHGYITFNGCMTIKVHKNILYTNWLANCF